MEYLVVTLDSVIAAIVVGAFMFITIMILLIAHAKAYRLSKRYGVFIKRNDLENKYNRWVRDNVLEWNDEI